MSEHADVSSQAGPAYQDPSRSVEERVADLISRMTLAEKISQMVHTAPAIERLGIPAYNWWNECLHGVARAGIATVFPQAIGLAATWDPDLIHKAATIISDEARAKHHEWLRLGIRQIYAGLTFWSPNVNLFRDPRWGRGQETYGEDPYLTSRLGVAFVRGLQGDDPLHPKVVATAKHFAVHSGPESERHRFDARVSERDLRETYLRAFEALVKEARVQSVMGAYNRTNGEACCASPTLLERILRDEWGFSGYVTSDCWAIDDLFGGHALVGSPAEAAAMAVKAGCDLECGCVYQALGEAVERNLVDEKAIDRSLGRLFAARFRLGMFDPPENVPYAQIPFAVNDSLEHRAVALETSRESIVLLKNDGLLPLSKDLGSVAVVGPNADDLWALLGNYNGTPARPVTVLEGIRGKLGPSARLYHAQGCELALRVPPLVPIPSDCLRPLAPDALGKRAGLTAECYGSSSFERGPAETRTDDTVDFAWKGRSDTFSVRWAGYLVPPTTGTYRLGVTGHSYYRLLLDGQEIVTYRGIHHPTQRTREVALEAGRLYPLGLEYANDGLDPQAHLLWSVPGVDYQREALEVAGKADVVIAVLGLSPWLEGEEMPVDVEGFRGGDRTDIALPRPQEELLRKLRALGKPLVLVLLGGSALAVTWADEHVSAILEGWYPGQAGGKAIADVLFGDHNPAGRLPVTFYRSLDQLPPFEDYAMVGRTYRYLSDKPLYPFGHGLSYTRFEYSGLRVAERVDASGELAVSFDLANAGERAGDEVAQLYLRYLDSRVARPIKELAAFQRVRLAPGEARSLAFRVPASQLAYWDGGRFVVEPGRVEVMVGASSEDIRLRGEVEISASG